MRISIYEVPDAVNGLQPGPNGERFLIFCRKIDNPINSYWTYEPTKEKAVKMKLKMEAYENGGRR